MPFFLNGPLDYKLQGRPQDFFRGGPDFFLRGTYRLIGLRVNQFLNASQQNTLLLSKWHFMARI